MQGTKLELVHTKEESKMPQGKKKNSIVLKEWTNTVQLKITIKGANLKNNGKSQDKLETMPTMTHLPSTIFVTSKIPNYAYCDVKNPKLFLVTFTLSFSL